MRASICFALSVIAVASTAMMSVTSPAVALKRSSVGGLCGGLAGIQCKAKLFCDYQPAVLCGAADATGTCQQRPRICTMDYRPVCGCDGKTYGNDCARRAARVGKVKDGRCTEE